MPPEDEGFVLDAGAFIALERKDRFAAALIRRAIREKIPLLTSAAVVAQVWRGGKGKQVPIALALHDVEIVDLSADVARPIGLLLSRAGLADPVDAHVALLAIERDWTVLTSDPDDLLRIEPRLRIERV